MGKTNIVTHPDTYEEFRSYMENDFLKRNDGYFPKHLKTWWTKVESAHKDIRNFLGGIRIERRIKLKSQQSPASMADAKPFIDEIKAVVPGYLNAYRYDDSVFLMPTVSNGTHNAFKISKHVRTFAEQSYVDNDSLKRLDKALSGLGAVWARSKTSDSELDVTLSTSPRGFALLGHYGPDQDSCFRQGSDKTQHKYILGQSKNTFIITISKFNPKKNKFTNVARCMGFANNSFNTFNLANYYFSHGFSEGDGLEAIRLFFEDIWKKESTLIEGKVHIETIFHNKYGNWTFVKGKESTEIGRQVLNTDIMNILLFNCPKCGYESGSGNNWNEVDDILVCHRCCSKANKCDISGELTFSTLVPLVDKSGGMKFISPKVADKYLKCDGCKMHAEELDDVGNNNKLCSDCLENGYTQCDECETLVPDTQIIEFDDSDICLFCVRKGNIPLVEWSEVLNGI